MCTSREDAIHAGKVMLSLAGNEGAHRIRIDGSRRAERVTGTPFPGPIYCPSDPMEREMGDAKFKVEYGRSKIEGGARGCEK